MFDFPKQDIVSDSYLFVKGANLYEYQRKAALASIANGKSFKAETVAIRYHKVRSGDTLGSISRKYNVSISRLCQLNGIKRSSILRVGQLLRCS